MKVTKAEKLRLVIYPQNVHTTWYLSSKRKKFLLSNKLKIKFLLRERRNSKNVYCLKQILNCSHVILENWNFFSEELSDLKMSEHTTDRHAR